MGLKTVECKNFEGYPEILIMGGTETIATVHHLGRDRDKEWRDRANAFKAAPDLLEALKEILSSDDGEISTITGECRYCEKRYYKLPELCNNPHCKAVKARAAIAKAEGKKV